MFRRRKAGVGGNRDEMRGFVTPQKEVVGLLYTLAAARMEAFTNSLNLLIIPVWHVFCPGLRAAWK